MKDKGIAFKFCKLINATQLYNVYSGFEINLKFGFKCHLFFKLFFPKFRLSKSKQMSSDDFAVRLILRLLVFFFSFHSA